MINSRKVFLGLIVLLCILCAGMLFGAHAADSVLASRSQTLVNLKAQNQATDDEKIQLVQDKNEISKYASLNQIAESVVPADKNQAETVREISNLAAASGIPQLSSITFPPSTLGGTSIKTSSGLTQVIAVKGLPGIDELPITITQSTAALVPYSDFTEFLSKIEQNRRTAEVSSITINPSQKTPNMIAFTLVLEEYLKP